MQFVFPSFLWALLLLAIPILIHLFYFRRFKKVYFTNVKFLKEVKEETSNRSRIRNLLVLLSRLAALAALIFAFAQPYLADKSLNQNRDNFVSLFVDNSFSMQSLSEDVPLIDKAKAKAREIVDAYSETDQFQIVTNELSGKQQRWISKEDALSTIDEIEITPKVNKLSKIVTRQTQLFDNVKANNSIYILSDFQQNISDLPTDIDTNLNVKILPFTSIQENNISIDSAYFLSPVPLKNQANPLVVKLHNYGTEAKNDVRLFINENGQTKPVGKFNIEANSTKTDTFDLVFLEGGWQNIEIKVEDFPIQFDDSYLVSFQLNNNVKILSLNDGRDNKYLTSLLRGLPNFQLTNQSISNIKYSEFGSYDLIILNDIRNISSGLVTEIENYVINGGKVLLFPSRNTDINNTNQLLSKLAVNTLANYDANEREVFKINTKEFIFENVYERIDNNIKLPSTKGNFTVTNFTSRGGENLLNYRDGSPFLQKYQKEKGIFYLCAAPLSENENNLVKIAEVFVPMIYKMALSKGTVKPLAYSIGKDNISDVPNISTGNETIFKIKGATEFIPGQTRIGRKTVIDFNNQVDKSGIYDLTLNDSIVDRYAFNYNRLESDLSFVGLNEIKEKYGDQYQVFENFMKAEMGTLVKQADKGRVLWRLFIILALIFLAIETLLLRFWKV